MDNTSSSLNVFPTHFCTQTPCPICNPWQAWNFPQYHPVPHRCPVCDGRGTVPHGFYDRREVSDCTAPEECRSCKGVGILWA